MNLRVCKISPAPVSTIDSIPLSSSPEGITTGGGLVWVATYTGIVGIYPVTDQITRRFRLPVHPPTSPNAIAYYDGRLWIAAT